MNLNEKGVSPPPKPDLAYSELRRANLNLFFSYMQDLYRWFLRMVDVFPLVQTTSLTIDPGSVGGNSTSAQTFTVNGLKAQDIVYVNKPSHTSGLIIGNVRVSAADTVEITFANITGVSINAGAETYTLVAIRR